MIELQNPTSAKDMDGVPVQHRRRASVKFFRIVSSGRSRYGEVQLNGYCCCLHQYLEANTIEAMKSCSLLRAPRAPIARYQASIADTSDMLPCTAVNEAKSDIPKQ